MELENTFRKLAKKQHKEEERSQSEGFQLERPTASQNNLARLGIAFLLHLL
jgi:hypothetical protein